MNNDDKSRYFYRADGYYHPAWYASGDEGFFGSRAPAPAPTEPPPIPNKRPAASASASVSEGEHGNFDALLNEYKEKKKELDKEILRAQHKLLQAGPFYSVRILGDKNFIKVVRVFAVEYDARLFANMLEGLYLKNAKDRAPLRVDVFQVTQLNFDKLDLFDDITPAKVYEMNKKQ